MSTLLNFTLGANTIDFEKGGSNNVRRPLELIQIVDRAADGSLQIEDLGVTINRRELTFNAMSKTDHDLLKNWFENIAEGAKNSFTFTDELGDSGTVKIVSPTFDFVEVFQGFFDGSITLEYV